MVTYGYIRMLGEDMALEKRVEVLFEKKKFTYLQHLAKREKTSVGNLIREAVATVYLEKEVDHQRGAMKRILEMEPVDFGPNWARTSWEEFKEEIAEGRYRATMKGMNGDEQS